MNISLLDGSAINLPTHNILNAICWLSNIRIHLLTKHIKPNYGFKAEYELASTMYKHS